MQNGSSAWNAFFDIISASGELLDTWAQRKPYVLDDEDFYGQMKGRERAARRRALHRLQRQRIIRCRRKGGKIYVELTQKGRHAALKAAILGKRRMLPDGIVCVVAFDIPESVRHVRWALRMMLKEAGFVQIQRSVWEGKRDVVDELARFVEKTGAGQWVQVYEAVRKTW